MDEKKVIEFVNNEIYTQESIEVFLFENKTTNSKLLKSLFKIASNNYGEYSQNYNTMCGIIKLITLLINSVELDENEIEVNKQRLEKLLSTLNDKYIATNDKRYLSLIERTKKIIVDKKKNITEIKKLITLLIDKKESIHVILAVINDVKSINSDGTLFDYIFKILVSSKELREYDQIYYVELLKIFYNKSINKMHYTKQLENIRCLKPILFNEVYNIIYGKFDSLSNKEINEKFGITEKLITSPLSPKTQRSTSDADVFTFDNSIFNIKDDGLSIKKDGNNYIVGIHMCDVGSSIRPESILDIQARNITKEIYLPEKKISMIPDSVKQRLSLDRGTKRGSVSLYVIMNNYGEIIDYYLSREDINVRLNLTYEDALRIIEKKHPNDFEKYIQKLYFFSEGLRKNGSKDKKYVTAKSNKFGTGLYNSKGFLMINEFMVLYNSLIPEMVSEKDIPFIYKAKDKSYIPNLIESEELSLDSDTLEGASNLFLYSYYTNTPQYHMSLGKKYYANCSAPMRKYSSLYNQYLLHMFFFKDQKFDFCDRDYLNLIEYLNDREQEIYLFTRGYKRTLTKD